MNVNHMSITKNERTLEDNQNGWSKNNGVEESDEGNYVDTESWNDLK